MTDFRDIFQPASKEEVERRKELNFLEDICSRERCGMCDYWMKTSLCQREARGFKVSMNNWPCNNYELNFSDKKRLVELRNVKDDRF